MNGTSEMSCDTLNIDTSHTDSLNFEHFIHQAQLSGTPNIYLERQAHVESNARSYPRRLPIAISRARGIYVEDTAGKVYIDCLACAGTLALGHNHPVVQKALINHLTSDAPLQTLDITTPIKDTFITKLFQSLPSELAKNARIQFCSPSGSDAVEAAVKLAKTATGRRPVLSFSGGYHGMTNGSLSLMGNLSAKAPIPNLMPEVQFLPYPYLYRCPFGLSGDQSINSNLHYIENLLSDPESGVLPPAAIIVEAIQGEGGVIPAPTRWLKGLRELTQRFKIPLIMDEVQSGLGRCGMMYAFEAAGIIPDILVLSKAIGGGLPLSVIVYKEELDTWSPGAHAGTFRGNQLAMSAGIATFDVIKSLELDKHARAMGEYLSQHLKSIQQDFSFLGDVRGRGLMLGVEIVDPEKSSKNKTHPTFPQLAKAIQQRCFTNGLILELGGRDGCTIRFLPPLIITKNEIDQVADIFLKAVTTALQDIGRSSAT